MADQPDPIVTSLKLYEFCALAKYFQEARQQDAFINFVMSGLFTDGDGTLRQAYIDVRQNDADDLQLHVRRDYDSALLRHTELPINGPVFITPYCTKAENISKTIHLKQKVVINDEEKTVPLHRIPNIKFGFWGARNSIHLFFPGLCDGSRPSHLTMEEKKAYYEQGLKPSVDEVLPSESADWPPSLPAELFRAKKARGGLSITAKCVGKDDIPHLVRGLKHHLLQAGHEWAEEMFFLLSIRGVKSSYRHDPFDFEALDQLAVFMSDQQLNLEDFDLDTSYIDVGFEIRDGESGKCLQWRSERHASVVMEALGIDQDNAERITSIGSSKYARDLTSHLTDVAGCRIEPGVRAQGPHEAVYLQLYSTDKSVTYHPENSHYAKAMSMKEAIGAIQPPVFAQNLRDTYHDASETNSSSARIEVRVPLSAAAEVLLHFEAEQVRSAIVAFSRAEWWAWRLMRLIGIVNILELQAIGDPEQRVIPDTLTLTAGSVWLLNSLHARPEDGPSARRLMDCILPLVDRNISDPAFFAYRVAVRPGALHQGTSDEEEESSESDEDSASRRRRIPMPVARELWEEDLVPYIPHGAIFLRSIINLSDVPRMARGGTFLDRRSFKFWFEKDYQDFVFQFNQAGVILPSEIPHSGITRKRARRTRDIISLAAEPLPLLFPDLSTRGIQLVHPANDDPEELVFGHPFFEPASEITGDINQVVTNLYRQCLVDLANKAPNIAGRSARSYLKLSEAERLDVNEELYQETRLSKYLRRIWYKSGSHSDWMAAVESLFPSKGKAFTSKIQNYAQCRYWIRWRRITRLNTKQTVDTIQSAIAERMWRQLKWIPAATNDRIWGTGKKPYFDFYPEGDQITGGVRILTKAGVKYEWFNDEANPTE